MTMTTPSSILHYFSDGWLHGADLHLFVDDLVMPVDMQQSFEMVILKGMQTFL